ncbi:hypothetical protein DSO57_1035590 [Entomophthora muscae]|uniref:Uncharacterized protein n=1 Tax=Entomophthora muscae TaxID=34485 RepID=A0ACC2TLY4_9FUNG|nr:hypothetical protein DSO57_1035590 [Entomophthora muscae]
MIKAFALIFLYSLPWTHLLDFPILGESKISKKEGLGQVSVFGPAPAHLPADFCPPGVPFGPVHFMKYPLKPEYKDYTPKKVLELFSLAHIKSAVIYNRQGPWYLTKTKLFRGKFNFLPVYQLDMDPHDPQDNACLLAQLPDYPHKQVVQDCLHHLHWGDWHNNPDRWPVVLGREVHVLPHKVIPNLVVGPAH